MLTSRWRKILGDLSINKMRTFYVILAISIGVFGFSVVINSYSILMREMDKNYMDTNPASAILYTDTLRNSYIQKIEELPYIKDAEADNEIIGRVRIGNSEWKDIWLFVINDFSNVKTDIFTPETGKAIPTEGEILLERKALSIAKAKVGDSLNVSIPDGKITTLKLTGTVHAPGLPPAWMEGCAYGYITPETLKLLGGNISNGHRLKITVSDNPMDKQHIKACAYNLKSNLEKDGYKVNRIDIPKPGKHPHATQMAALLMLMETFGILSLLLSGVLVANMVSAILEQQTRQIGIMKAIGASSRQIIGLYQGMVIVFSVIAMAISIPLGIFAGRGYAWLAAAILNFDIFSNHIPTYVFILEGSVGLLVPMLTAAVPIIKGSRITAYESINNYGISLDKYTRESYKPSSILRFLPRPFILSIRNTFRRKGRLIFSLLVMALGGMGFIVAMNVYASMYSTVDAKVNSTSYDISVTFCHPESVPKINSAINNIPGITKTEVWNGVNASRVYMDKTCGESFNIIAPPANTKLMSAQPLYSGRWLKPEDENAIVINQRLLSNEPDIKIGSTIKVRINQIDTQFKVIGVSRELLGVPTAYANSEYLSKLLKNQGLAKNLMIVTQDSNPSSSSDISKLIEKSLVDGGLNVSSLTTIADYRKSLVDHMFVIATFLIVMSLLVVLVGGLGLATTISINVLERTKEIGIMRSIGATGYSMTGIIVLEGIIIGLLSWCLAAILSVPVSRIVAYKFGMVFFESPLVFAPSFRGYAIWFAIVIVFAALASFSPSWKAAKMPVKNAIAYD